MKSHIQTSQGHSRGNNVFSIEYIIKDNSFISSKFDIDLYNYGHKIILSYNNDELKDPYDYTIEDRAEDFIMESCRLQKLCTIDYSNSKKTPEQDIEYIKASIDELCAKWDLTHTIID